MIKIIAESHSDHNLTDAHCDYALGYAQAQLDCSGAGGVCIISVELPELYDTVPCALVGPAVGGEPVPESEAHYAKRGDRPYLSRVVVDAPQSQTNIITVVVGPHEEEPHVLYTMYAGPAAPREPGDPSLEGDELELQRSQEFWAKHALSSEVL